MAPSPHTSQDSLPSVDAAGGVAGFILRGLADEAGAPFGLTHQDGSERDATGQPGGERESRYCHTASLLC